jgi:SAM-dependent methyltransferase
MLEHGHVNGQRNDPWKLVHLGGRVKPFYDKASAVILQAYDALFSTSTPAIAGDVAFYERVARRLAGPVAEIGCGTGRIALPLACAGLDVTGVDLSEGMLDIARRKLGMLPAPVRARVALVAQDMCELHLERRFDFIFVAFRSFQHLLTIDLQTKALQAIVCHLAPAGRVALHLFDPRLDLLVEKAAAPPRLSGTHPETGRHYVGEVLRTELDHVNQIRRDLWRFAEVGADGQLLAEDVREMALRWTYRWELYHLLRLCGLAVEAEYSDFFESPPTWQGIDPHRAGGVSFY